jgi:decaprenylphospho-beta-D-ribofuranose 2-oxidase
VQSNVIGHPEIGLHYGIICLAPYNFFKKILVVNYEQFTPNKRQARTVYKLHKEKFVELGKLGMELKRNSKIVNRISNWTNWPFMVMEETAGHTTCRNNAMRHPVAFLEHEATINTDVLQSYFIPPHNFVAFMEYLATCARSKDLQIFFALTRYIPKNTESFLAYTKDNYFEIVLFINHGTSQELLSHAEQWTQTTVDKVLALGGNYYLPVRLNPTKAQLKKAYPQIDMFFSKKRYYDPDELFMNGLYAKYKN